MASDLSPRDAARVWIRRAMLLERVAEKVLGSEELIELGAR